MAEVLLCCPTAKSGLELKNRDKTFQKRMSFLHRLIVGKEILVFFIFINL